MNDEQAAFVIFGISAAILESFYQLFENFIYQLPSPVSQIVAVGVILLGYPAYIVVCYVAGWASMGAYSVSQTVSEVIQKTTDS